MRSDSGNAQMSSKDEGVSDDSRQQAKGKEDLGSSIRCSHGARVVRNHARAHMHNAASSKRGGSALYRMRERKEVLEEEDNLTHPPSTKSK